MSTHSLEHCNGFVTKQQRERTEIRSKNLLSKLVTSRDGSVKSTETRQG